MHLLKCFVWVGFILCAWLVFSSLLFLVMLLPLWSSTCAGKEHAFLGQPEVVFAASLHVHPIATWVCQVKLLI